MSDGTFEMLCQSPVIQFFLWILVQYYTSMPNDCKLIKLSKNPQNEDIPKVIPNGLALKAENTK